MLQIKWEEKKIVRWMIEHFCKKNHHQNKQICPDCETLFNYSSLRIDHCPKKENKPVCSQCTIHCYSSSYKDKIKSVMRYSGPKMIFYHPVIAITYILKKLKKEW